MTMPEVSYSQLLNQYHTAISKAQNYQEELAKKKEQWEKRISTLHNNLLD